MAPEQGLDCFITWILLIFIIFILLKILKIVVTTLRCHSIETDKLVDGQLAHLDVSISSPEFTEKIALCNLPRDAKHLTINRRVGAVIISETKTKYNDLTIVDQIFLVDSLALSFDIPSYYRCISKINPGNYDGYYTFSSK